jgi:hypothetical protein
MTPPRRSSTSWPGSSAGTTWRPSCAWPGARSERFPLHASDEHWLTTFIGREQADALCKRYGGDTLWIPKNDGGVRQLRDTRIKALRTEGATINALATEFRLTDRQIYNILSEAAEEG